MLESLIEKESIQTTYAKAKECQRMAEKMITLGKKNTQASKNRAEQIFYVCWHYLLICKKCSEYMMANRSMQRPKILMPKLFGPLRERYMDRAGGYTRVLRIEPTKEDQAPSAILELVDGPKDMRWNLTARTMAREIRDKLPRTELTRTNIKKVTRYRKDGIEELETLAEKLVIAADPVTEEAIVKVPEKKRVYPEPGLLFGKDRKAYGIESGPRRPRAPQSRV